MSDFFGSWLVSDLNLLSFTRFGEANNSGKNSEITAAEQRDNSGINSNIPSLNGGFSVNWFLSQAVM
jgi:hypothetical protein